MPVCPSDHEFPKLQSPTTASSLPSQPSRPAAGEPEQLPLHPVFRRRACCCCCRCCCRRRLEHVHAHLEQLLGPVALLHVVQHLGSWLVCRSITMAQHGWQRQTGGNKRVCDANVAWTGIARQGACLVPVTAVPWSHIARGPPPAAPGQCEATSPRPHRDPPDPSALTLALWRFPGSGSHRNRWASLGLGPQVLSPWK